jgi:mycothiol synthase
MTIKHRPYNGIQDFILMTSILAVGRKTTNCSYYVHVGDLSWWMFYSDWDASQWEERVTLWERNGHPCGWSLIDPDWYSFDVYLLPEMQGSKDEAYILDWTIRRAADSIRQHGGQQIRTVWVSDHDHKRKAQLEQRDFVEDEAFMWYLEHPLNACIPLLNLPQDFVVRPIHGEGEIFQRTVASYNAFSQTRPFDEYWPRYQRFMRSPVYNPNFDLVIETPDGQFASFCIIWPDPVNHIGLFEPVGTHLAYRRQGLGKAVITAGLQQMHTWGMKRAMICVDNHNPAALLLYESVGFTVKQKLMTYRKTIR